MVTSIQTKRLRLRPLQQEDKAFILELLNTPGWLQYIGDRQVRNEADALRYIEEGPLKSYREHGHGLYLVELREEAVSLGLCGLLQRKGWADIDIGFAFLPAYMGFGYAFEAAEAVLQEAREGLRRKRVIAIVLENNVSSIRLLEKLGLRFEKKILHEESQEELLQYAIAF